MGDQHLSYQTFSKEKERLMGYSCRQPSLTMNTGHLSKYMLIFVALTTSVLCFLLWWMDTLEFQRIPDPAFVPQVLTSRHNLCAFRPLSPEEAVEEEFILHSIAWPETPSVTLNFSLKNTTDPSCSKFTILPKVGGGQWSIGDQLEVRIIMKDYYCHPKTSGGDALLARLRNEALDAGVSGQVVDHLNGSYTAVFPLVWEGRADVQVTLIHPSEAITVLRRLNNESLDRVFFRSVFRSGSVTETSMCNVCLRPTNMPVCNYTDIRTGEPWFCLKPKSLSCNARIIHSMGGYLPALKPLEDKLFSKVNMKVPILASGSSYITVLPNTKGQVMMNSTKVKFRPSGFYYKGVWKSLGGTQVYQFDTQSIIQCLSGKVVHFYGDSTIRQWFEYLNKALPDLKEFNLHTPERSSPYVSLDYKNNILLTYHCHGLPIRIRPIPISQLRYIANELDNIHGGSNTVIAFTVWAHFGNFPMEFYIRRLLSIRSAVLRLLARAPDTLVVIRTGNLKSYDVNGAINNGDWYALQRDRALREVFKGMNVDLVDAWEMTLAHRLQHNLHPAPPIIKNMINVLLSYICPKHK
ncbi:NXPE family member 3-like isoform X4 [Gouania willdenowi]|uniref:NXPE family member 3-like isoform X4 n=2 Tax=Gouania willdenowi TaxID=441366 RepID=UPI0010555CD3|nr:NXPE family member 3-like isoform X4 [Gouania willdenowi]